MRRGDRLLRFRDVCDRLALGASRVYELRHERSDFPEPVKLGGAVRWSEAEIAALIERLKDERRVSA